jgi:heat-inducible transcriptional repressor
MAESALSERAKRILAAVVAEYVSSGEPVASATLAERGGFGVSSATLRNELARLERLGYLKQPHTSAGRIPTDAGYRCYVDQLLAGLRRIGRPAQVVRARLVARSGQAPLMDEALQTVSHVLSSTSHHVGFALAPAADETSFQQIDFVPLAGSRILVVVVESGGRVINKVVDTGEAIDLVRLREAANYLNTEFSGWPLAEVRAAVAERMAWERSLYDELLARALRLASAALETLEVRAPLFVDGAATLLDASRRGVAGAVPLDTLRALLQMVEEKHRLVRILNEYIDGPGLTVVIGGEHSTPDLRAFSLVTAPFGDNRCGGAVGVIGPTRMRYSRAIAVVDSVAAAVSQLITEGTWSDRGQ